MESRGRVNGERAIAVAKEMGVDIARLQKDMDGRRVQRRPAGERGARRQARPVAARRPSSSASEIIPGAVGLDPLKQVVASVRQCGKATC